MTGTIPSYMFYVVALVLFAYGVYLINKERPVSPSQAAILGLAVVAAFLPVIANFELSDKGVKVTLVEKGAELTDQVKEIATRQESTSKDIEKLAAGVKSTNEKIASLEAALKKEQPTLGTGPSFGKSDPAIFDTIIKSSQTKSDSSRNSIQRLEDLQKDFKVLQQNNLMYLPQ